MKNGKHTRKTKPECVKQLNGAARRFARILLEARAKLSPKERKEADIFIFGKEL